MTDGLAPDLQRLAGRLARAEGRRDALRERGAALQRDIALAKARLEARDAVEGFIEAVQEEASRRNVQSFETLLTALVREVLPGEKPVVLDLSTERGLASLDIALARPDGSREDVLEDNGGALTNVVGMALRLIAVVKAGAGRFLALDEADCWIAPERVPAFYRILVDGAARLGVQCLAISHHDVSRFAGDLRVCRIVGEPGAGVTLACPDGDASWDDAAPGLRFIRLLDVQGYRDATLTLSPGVNALVGPNNRGKSTLVRALRAVFYGEARDSLVRAGAATATVEIGVAGGRVLRFVRRPRRTPVNLWSLHEPDGRIVEEDGTRLETGGRSVPAWVERLCGIRKVEELDVHIAHQKFPVFLLGEPPSRRSAVLSIGQEAAYLRDMLSIHRERCARDMALVRTGERELAAITESLRALDALPALAAALAAARASAAALARREARLAALLRHATALETGRLRLARARMRAGACEGLPGPEAFRALARSMAETRERERTAGALAAAQRRLDRAWERHALLSGLPEEPALAAAEAIAGGHAARLAALRAALADAQARAAQAADAMAAIRAETDDLLAASGGACPTCGAPVDADALLHDHATPGRRAA